jgi:hypothetical protein
MWFSFTYGGVLHEIDNTRKELIGGKNEATATRGGIKADTNLKPAVRWKI